MSVLRLDVNVALQLAEAMAVAARDALADEHERDFTTAVDELHHIAGHLHELVGAW